MTADLRSTRIERLLDLIGCAEERRPQGRANLDRLSDGELATMVEQAEVDHVIVATAVARWTGEG